jgi:hypothetical protein
LDWIISAIFWAIILVWEAAPAIVIWPARKSRVLSIPGTIIAAALVVLGNGAAWYIASHDRSSTAVLIFVVSPAYILGAQLVLTGADVGIRGVARAWHGRSGAVGE